MNAGPCIKSDTIGAVDPKISTPGDNLDLPRFCQQEELDRVAGLVSTALAGVDVSYGCLIEFGARLIKGTLVKLPQESQEEIKASVATEIGLRSQCQTFPRRAPF